jgi:hypothetical protein
MRNLWFILYPKSSPFLLQEVLNIFTEYWSNPKENLIYGYTLEMAESNFSFWKYFTKITNSPFFFTEDYAIRMTCVGITECGVERVFSYIKWILGMKRHRLSKEMLYNLIQLKDV